jgi:hypothetical protein
MMKDGRDVRVHGQASPSLIRNRTEFQSAWSCWHPHRYHVVDIHADIERENPSAPDESSAIMPFSAGVDSCYTVWRHTRDLCGRWRRKIAAAVMIHGFDIPLDMPWAFRNAFEKSRFILERTGIELIPVSSNYRGSDVPWAHAFGAGLVSILRLFQPGFRAALIASGDQYDIPRMPYPGSNFVTDWMMSSESFPILHDGAAVSRAEKIREISAWPEAMRYLRVCLEDENKEGNCCRCEKCVRTILEFRCLGLDRPPCFEKEMKNRHIFRLPHFQPAGLVYLTEVDKLARGNKIRASWVYALRLRLFIHAVIGPLIDSRIGRILRRVMRGIWFRVRLTLRNIRD